MRVDTYEAKIFIAGDYATAQQVCREFCHEFGACVTVTPTEYVYTGGQEAGVIVGFINYPRFPQTGDQIKMRAFKLADRLRERLCQHSYTIVASDGTIWDTTRDQK